VFPNAGIASKPLSKKPPIAFHFDRMRHGRLRSLIDAVNRLPSAPPLALPDRDATSAAATPLDAVEDGGGGASRPAPALDAALVQLVGRAGGPDATDAAAATAALQGVLGAGSLSPGEQETLVGELFPLVAAAPTPAARQQLLAALAASSPFVDGDRLDEALGGASSDG